MIRILVSACLLGHRVRYDGSAVPCDDAALERWQEQGRLVPFCPELAGGLSAPRPPAEIVGGGGFAVLDGRARVVAINGQDVTDRFCCGARAALAEARACGAALAILKDGSPSCGSSYIYDGSFAGATRPGSGVTVAVLERNGIRVFGEHQIHAAAAYLQELETR